MRGVTENASTTAASRPSIVRGISLAVASVLALAGLSVAQMSAAPAAQADDAALHVDAYFTAGMKYQGIGVDVKTTGVSDATGVRVTVHRSSGGDVVKSSNPGGGVPASINMGKTVTAPIVIQPGAYDEAGSSSWLKPDAVWSAETIPTGVTVEILRGSEAILTSTLDSVATTLATLGDVMPTAVTLHVDSYFRDDATMTGIGVDMRTTGVTDADEVRVTVHRLVGGDVVKTSRSTGTVPGTINAGSTVTAPIVIRAGGTYNEAASGSWYPADAVWAAETVPTGVTVEVLRGGVVLVEQTTESFGPASGPTLAGVMPDVPELTNVRATYRDQADYQGITVDFQTTGFTDAERITVQVDREGASPVIKSSKPTASFLKTVNTGGSGPVTAPIVIQSGTYNEAGSSSWFKPVAVWTPASVPTQVTVTVERAYGADLVQTVSINDAKATAADVLPTEVPAPAPVVVEVPTDVPTYQVDVPADVADVELKLGATAPSTGGGAEVSVPVEVVVTTTVGAQVTIAKDTTATSSDPAWDGVIELPKVKTDVVVPAASGQTTTVGVALQMGSSTARIDFDSPVKLVLAGQAGKSAGYIDQGGAFHAIGDACTPPAPAGLTDGECWVNDGADLVIWTTHFTTFVSYTSAASPAPGGGTTPAPSTGGGGAGGTTGGTSFTPSTQQVAPATAPVQTPSKVKTSTTKAPVTPPAANAPESDAEPEAAPSPSAQGGFDPFWLLVIAIPVVVIIGVAVTVTVVRARRA